MEQKKMIKAEDYRKKFNGLMSELAEQSRTVLQSFGNYREDIKRQKISESTEKLKETYSDKAKSLLETLESNRKELAKKKIKIEYPFFSDEGKMAIGNSMISDATNYLNSSHSISDILTDIKSAVSLGRIDFASQIINTILSRPEDINNQKAMLLRDKVLEARRELYSGSSHSEIESSLKDFDLLKNEVGEFAEAIADGYFNYLPKSEVEKFSQDQVHKHIDSISNSQMKYWSSDSLG